MNDLPYFTAIGAWGDVFACYARICLMMKETGLPKANILHYGFDPHIKDFLEYQDNIEEVLHLVPDSLGAYDDVIAEANTGSMDWINELKGWAHLNHNLMIMGHTTHDIISKKIINRHFDYRIPPSSVPLPLHSVLFNPYSFQSCSFRAHWPFMPNVLRFLLDETDWHVVLVGQEKTFNTNGEYWDFPMIVDHPEVTNLVGKTESMFEVLAIAEDCEAIISTSNCLSLWSIIADKPSIVLMNSKLTDPFVIGHEYWKEWVETEPNKCVYYDQNFDQFRKAYQGWNVS